MRTKAAKRFGRIREAYEVLSDEVSTFRGVGEVMVSENFVLVCLFVCLFVCFVLFCFVLFCFFCFVFIWVLKGFDAQILSPILAILSKRSVIY